MSVTRLRLVTCMASRALWSSGPSTMVDPNHLWMVTVQQLENGEIERVEESGMHFVYPPAIPETEEKCAMSHKEQNSRSYAIK